MEGPSLYIAAEQLVVFRGKKVRMVSGNTRIGKERLLGKKVFDVFAWGKHLVFQFDTFAMRTHFLLFGTYEAVINGKAVTGDYRRTREPRLKLEFTNGDLSIFNGSIKFIEDTNLKKTYDYRIDIMSEVWDERYVKKCMKDYPNEEIADVLLDQTVFAGVGNIIKNEVLSIVKIQPKRHIKTLSRKEIQEITETTRRYSFQFYEWRKIFQLIAHLNIHRKAVCPYCGRKIIREKTGKRKRWSYFCPTCQI